MPVSTKSLIERLSAVRAKRGYLLPHHGLLAIADGDMLAAYDQLYSLIAYKQRALSRHDAEFVWLAILIATDEALASHHIKKFRDAGGEAKHIEAAMRLAAIGLGTGAFGFVASHWLPHLPDIDPARAYDRAVKLMAGAVRPRIAHLAMVAVQTCRADWRALEWALIAARRARVPEAEIAEALTLAMFPGSVPYFVEACGVWRKLIAERRVPASAMFRAWADMPGQGGFDEASKAKRSRASSLRSPRPKRRR